ncbi:hypothetical protein RB595_007380 [Gaeumannomyces hyphopodioides]
MAATPPNALGPALVAFAVEGSFPDEHLSSFKLAPEELPAGIKALQDAKSTLEDEIRTINHETADDVKTWYGNAKTLQDDINRSKQMAGDIQREAEEPEVSGKTVEEAESRAAFLVRELNYNDQLIQTLRAIKAVTAVLDEVEKARAERRILDALHLLEKSWSSLDALSVNGSCKAVKLLNLRAFELKSDVHEVFDHVWSALVHLDAEKSEFRVQQTRPDEPMGLSDAVVGLKAYKEVDRRMSDLWHDLDEAIVGPRMDLQSSSPLPGIQVQDQCLRVAGESVRTVEALFADLVQILKFLAAGLPLELVQVLSTVMVPEIINRIINVWLSAAVPASLKDMDEFQAVVESARVFCAQVTSLGFSELDDLQEWVESAPKVWLSKCREAALDTIRTKLSQGLGTPKQVERIETQVVSRSEGKELAANGLSAGAAADDHGWDSAWSDGGAEEQQEIAVEGKKLAEPAPEVGDDDVDAWGAWGADEETSDEVKVEDAKFDAKNEPKEDEKQAKGDAEDANNEEGDAADAWGWGEDDAQEEAEPPAAPESKPAPNPRANHKANTGSRELTLKETYNISSMPDPVLSLIFSILEDGAALTQTSHEGNPVAAAAAGLFGVPTLVLAMFRAVSPYYYSAGLGGNMYLYNDATYLAGRLTDYAAAWKTRQDLTSRARNMLRIDNDIKALQAFANRAYSNEMSTQKTIVKDLLGGQQSVMEQSFMESAVAQVRSVSAAWDGILTKSAWFQAAGSLVDAVATKVIADVMEMPSIGQDEAYNIANMISSITELDDLFPPTRIGDEQIPSTNQYVPSWLRLKYLSEVLQSNLREVRYLWIESELSLYFTLEETLDLINASFEDNARTREIVREIKANPQPIQA